MLAEMRDYFYGDTFLPEYLELLNTTEKDYVVKQNLSQPFLRVNICLTETRAWQHLFYVRTFVAPWLEDSKMTSGLDRGLIIEIATCGRQEKNMK